MSPLLGLLALAVGAGLVTAFFLQAKRDLAAAHKDLERFEGITNLEKHKQEVDTKLRKARSVLPKFESLADMERHRTQLANSVSQLEEQASEWQARIDKEQSLLAQLESDVSSVEETLEMQSFGFYKPRYGFDDSSRYTHELEKVRSQQKSLIARDQATHCPTDWTVEGSAAKGRKMIQEHAKLMLRAFNGEADAAIAKVKYDNVNNLEKRLTRSFEALNKLGKAKNLWITQEYLTQKLAELYLVHEHREKVQEEKEEQRRVREEMKEEERAQKEIEKARKDAEKEESAKGKALEKAQKELAIADAGQVSRLQDIVDRLEHELKEALERKAKAIARAQLTRSGHVYVLSNVGSFGEGVYKIGMTRRLEPLDRVRELGDASVPFRYDVHAMIYSEDAPALENALHKRFDSQRVNMANLRREFFRVSLDKIHDAVRDLFREVTFVTVPEAEEYRRTQSILEADGAPREEALYSLG